LHSNRAHAGTITSYQTVDVSILVLMDLAFESQMFLTFPLREMVSILVLMDLAFESQITQYFHVLFNVSILVLMDLAFESGTNRVMYSDDLWFQSLF